MRYILVPLALGALLGATPLAAPTVGNGFDVAPQAAAATGQLNPAVAFNGTDTYLVVWEAGWEGEGFSTDIMGARIGADGSRLDSAGFVICSAPGAQQRPVVAWGGSQWLVAWQDLRNGQDFEIYGARVSAAGQVLDANGALFYGGPNNQIQPALASDGTSFCLAWSDFRDGASYHIRLGRVSAAGLPLDGTAGVDADRNNAQERTCPRIVWTGSHWFVAWASYGWTWWNEMGEIYSATWTSTLVQTGGAVGIKNSSQLQHPALAADGGNALVAWSKGFLGRGDCGPVVSRRASIDAAGSVTVQPTADLTPSNAFKGSRHHTAGASGGVVLVTWWAHQPWDQFPTPPAANAHIFGARVQLSDGALLDGGVPFTISPAGANPQRNPSVAGGLVGQYLVVYEVDRGIGSRRIEARLVQN